MTPEDSRAREAVAKAICDTYGTFTHGIGSMGCDHALSSVQLVWQDIADAAIAALRALGWRAPDDPVTDEMAIAAAKYWNGGYFDAHPNDREYIDSFRAAIEAALGKGRG